MGDYNTNQLSHLMTMASTLAATPVISLTEPTDGDVSKDWLEVELRQAQESLDKRVAKIEESDNDGAGDDDDYDDDDYEGHKGTPLDQLHELHGTVEALALSQDVTKWSSQCQHQHNNNSDLFGEAQDCVELANILCRHDHSSLHQNIFDREYQPLHTYVRHNLILQLRNMLLKAGYPSVEACGRLLDRVSDATAMCHLTQCCEWLTKLQAMHHRVTQYTHHPQSASATTTTPWAAGETCDCLCEFMRPLVERVRFHFVDYHQDRVTTTKIDRLPEWLLHYLQEHVLEGSPAPNVTSESISSPWELITTGLAPFLTEEMPTLFANELVGLIKHVLQERNFFRHAKIAGPESDPMVLCQAIEQLLNFDDALRSLMPMGQADRLLRLMDIFVAGDEELLAWWLAREKEMVFHTLFHDDTAVDGGIGTNKNNGKQAKEQVQLDQMIKTRISPRAELFCALIRSVQIKASVFSFSGPYLNAVAVPMCMQFLDAVHESATELRNVLAGPRLASYPDLLGRHLKDWMAVFNGTRLAAAILTRENPWAQQSMAPSINSSVNDLARFGRSLEQLQNVLVDEFATTFVEVFLMERTRLASYLMRCSHFLAYPMEEEDEEDDFGDVSTDLKPSCAAFLEFLKLCEECDDESTANNEQSFATEFAPRVMQEKVVPAFADKFLEVAIDLHGLTPEVIPEGAAIFASDVQALFQSLSTVAETKTRFPVVERLLDVVRLMSLPASSLVTLQSALSGLVGGPEDPSRPWQLHVHQFTADATLFDEAVSMLRAKGFSCELEDAISVFNRRRDLASFGGERD